MDEYMAAVLRTLPWFGPEHFSHVTMALSETEYRPKVLPVDVLRAFNLSEFSLVYTSKPL